MRKHLSSLFILWMTTCLLPTRLLAQDNYEIQIYGAATQKPGTLMTELHSNYTQQAYSSGLLQSGERHALHETLELTAGLSSCVELGVYIFSRYQSEDGFHIIGIHIRPRIAAPADWHLPVGLSLSAELGTQNTRYVDAGWNLEIRPIIDRQFARWYLSFNPAFGMALAKTNLRRTPAFEPGFKFSCRIHPRWCLGVEYFGSIGYFPERKDFNSQSHAVYFVADLAEHPRWELNIGPGLGLTPSTDRLVWKCYVGRRLTWKQKKYHLSGST
jgi:hypothetical protein